MTTGKTIDLTRRTFVDKVISLLFNMLPRLVITFLLRSKCLLISWLQSPSAVILEPPKIKSATVPTVSPSSGGFPGGSAVKNLPTMQAIWVQSLDWEDPLEEGMATPSSSFAWRIPWTEESGRLQSIGSQRVGHN